MINLVLVLSLLFALIVAIFAVQNNTPVDIAFLGWKVKGMSLVLIIIGSAAAGAVTVFSLGLVKQFRLRRDLHQIKTQNDKLISQITALEARSEASPKETPGVGEGSDKSNGCTE